MLVSDSYDLPAEENPKQRQGRKKVSTSVIPRTVLLELALAMTEGDLKYKRFNFRESKIYTSDYIDAADRHFTRFIEGEDIDPDSGLPHLTKLIACLFVLRDAQIAGTAIDDRAPAIVDQKFFDSIDTAHRALQLKYLDNIDKE